MRHRSLRVTALVSAAFAGAALGIALIAESWGGVVPCALCLLERWPYRIAFVLGLAAAVVPPRYARWLLILLAMSILVGAGLALVHVGVEFGWWPSPLPECAAPRFSGGSIAQRLAAMPARPAKPCDAPTFLIPGLPVSMAAMNLVFASTFFVLLAFSLDRRPRGR